MFDITRRALRTRGLMAVAALAVPLALAGCWGGGGDDSVATTTPPVVTPPGTTPAAPVPASASASVSAMVAYLKSLVSDETSSPLDVTGFAPPRPDNEEPTVL